MILDFVIAILVVRFLKKKFQTAELLPEWDKVFNIIMGASIALLVLSATFIQGRLFFTWGAHLLLLGLVYILYTKEDFSSGRSYLIAIAPYILVSILKDAIQMAFDSLYNAWKTYLEAGIFFSTVWLIGMLVQNSRQQKALLKEKKKTKEEEEQNRIMAVLKADLEVQVVERTAEITRQKEELQKAFIDLKSTQSQLIQSEKMASLGELTAGIAHEIQNPLNFVNNFSEVNSELIDELQAELKAGNSAEAFKILDDIKGNEQKINHHGKRADAIVKGMLQHSRSSSSQKELTDLNDLADEYLRLSYHGLRAKDKSFNAAIETHFDKNIGEVNIVPQDIGRVLLNFYNNAFYAVAEKKKQAPGNYEPTVIVSTKTIQFPPDRFKVLISVKDNGNGIPQTVLDKIFQPFFTTKPTGQGTGLGLSLSYDIIKAHNGEIKVDTKEGVGTEFRIYL